VVEHCQLAETRWGPTKRRPTAHIIHNFGRADALDRAALERYTWPPLVNALEQVFLEATAARFPSDP